MIAPATYDFPPITSGDTFGCPRVDDGALEVCPLRFKIGIDLTGYTIRMQARLCSSAPVMDLSTEDGSIAVSDAVSGEFNIPPFIMDAPAGNYSYDMEFTMPDGGRFTFLKGALTVVNDVTK